MRNLSSIFMPQSCQSTLLKAQQKKQQSTIGVFNQKYQPLLVKSLMFFHCKLIHNLQFQKSNNIQQQMLNRQIETLSQAAPRTVGKFYQTQKLNPSKEAESRDNVHMQPQPIRARTKSVGHIYNTKFSSNKPSPQKLPISYNIPTKINYDRPINFKEIESKLSNCMESTLRSNSRQKYNYLSSHYNLKYDSLSGMNRANEQRYGNMQPTLLKNNHQYKENPPTAMKERKYSLTNQIGIQSKEILKESVFKIEKPASMQQRTQVKTLKNSRKTQNKQKVTIIQSSSSKHYNKQNMFPTYAINSKKQVSLGMVGINHEEYKQQLENKLKRMINNYQAKNKELENQLRKIQAQPQPHQKKKEGLPIKPLTAQTQTIKENPPIYKNEFLQKVLNELIDYNLKGINLNKECDQKLQDIWKSIHHQIMSDEHLRIVKCFINQTNINEVLTIVNQNRIKKIDVAALKTHPDQYDPFLIEKINELIKNNNPDFTHKQTCKWISEQLAKFYEASEKNMLKNLSQEKMECTILTMALEKEVKGLRRSEAKEFVIRDFTRYMSTLFKANLRNRNVFQIFNKIKGMSYIGRFIELLEEKAGKGADLKKLPFASK